MYLHVHILYICCTGIAYGWYDNYRYCSSKRVNYYKDCINECGPLYTKLMYVLHRGMDIYNLCCFAEHSRNSINVAFLKHTNIEACNC